MSTHITPPCRHSPAHRSRPDPARDPRVASAGGRALATDRRRPPQAARTGLGGLRRGGRATRRPTRWKVRRWPRHGLDTTRRARRRDRDWMTLRRTRDRPPQGASPGRCDGDKPRRTCADAGTAPDTDEATPPVSRSASRGTGGPKGPPGYTHPKRRVRSRIDAKGRDRPRP